MIESRNIAVTSISEEQYFEYERPISYNPMTIVRSIIGNMRVNLITRNNTTKRKVIVEPRLKENRKVKTLGSKKKSEKVLQPLQICISRENIQL